MLYINALFQKGLHNVKVGVLTYHGSINPGAFWQTYSTCQLLQSMGHDVEVIDYLHVYRHKRGVFWPAKNRRAWSRPDLLLRSCIQQYYSGLSRKELPLGDPVYTATDLESRSFDAVVIGSDVVWEQPFDPVFLGKHINTDLLIAYATSAGGSKAHESDVPEELLKPTPFTNISVRDENTFKFLKRGEPSWSKEKVLVSDPTITLKVPEVCKRRRHEKPYVMLYCSNKIPAGWKKEIRRLAKEKGWDVFAVFYHQRGFKNMTRITAFDWLSYLMNAEAVITNTFHGSVLSCLHRVPLAVGNMSPETMLKSEEQFLSLGLKSHLVERLEELEVVLSCDYHTDYMRLKTQNLEFLRKALS